MTHRQFSGLAGLAAAVVLALVSQASAQKIRKSTDAVKVKATAGKVDDDGKQVVTLALEIASPFHLYANPVGKELFVEAQTTVTVGGKAKLVKVEYPPGKTHKDPDGDYKVYEGKVTIKAVVQRGKGDKGPLELGIKVQACDEKRCLMPGTVKVTVP
jgi:DsbC/DsbD-like thiol-disulfide interchange protein